MTPDATPYDEGQRELESVTLELRARLEGRGVELVGGESPDELVQLLDAVERFERVVEAKGGDLMMDEGPHGDRAEPDDPHFLLPLRRTGDDVPAYLKRIDAAAEALRGHRRIDA